jgi:hypothetical protein
MKGKSADQPADVPEGPADLATLGDVDKEERAEGPGPADTGDVGLVETGVDGDVEKHEAEHHQLHHMLGVPGGKM